MSTSTLINFSHPITDKQRKQLIELLDFAPQIIEWPIQIDWNKDIAYQAKSIIDDIESQFNPDWPKISKLMIVLPGLSAVAVLLYREIEKRCHFRPSIVVVAPKNDGGFREFIVADIIDMENAGIDG